jgi:SAM-dependent methyltransferase
VDLKQFCFVDVGCGKGRALLIASRYPFAQLIGVEYAKKLCQQASRNLERCGVPAHRSQIICQDAAYFRFPEQNLVAYFYNPFDATVLSAVMCNLFPIAQRHSVFVAWEGPNREVLSAYAWLEKFVEDRHHTCLFRGSLKPYPIRTSR